MPAPALLLDSPSLFYRAFFALPPSIRDDRGRAVNAVRGYLDMTSRLLVDRRPRAMVHGFDDDWRPAFRVAAYPGYKAQRRADPPELPWQSELLAAVLGAAGVAVAVAPGLEADDLLGTLATRAGVDEPVEVVTGDRDLLQLVRDPSVAVLFTVRGVSDLHRFDAGAVRARYGVDPSLYTDLAILRGDPSDGLPGVRGIGEKTAARLLTVHGGLDALLAAPELAGPRLGSAIAAAREYVAAMRIVVPVVTDAAYRISEPVPVDRTRLRELGVAHNLDGPVRRMLAALEASAPRPGRGA